MRTIPLDSLDLAEFIRPGDGIVVGQGTSEPIALTQALVAQRERLGSTRLFFGSGFSDVFTPEASDRLHYSGIGGIGTHRRLTQAGCFNVLPCHISSVSPLLQSGAIPCDVLLVQVSPPNERGEYSWSLANDYLRAALGKARIVIAEVNAQAPWTPCDAPLTEAEITVRVNTDRPLLQLPSSPFGDLERRIATFASQLIPDRATLQVGIGAIPEAIMAQLKDRRDLGIHSGMIGDSVADLMEAGVVTNACKEIDQGISVTGTLFGTDRLYRFAHRNTAIRLAPTSYTHGSASLGRLRRLVSLNSALEVDLSGQVNAEALGNAHIGAVGGQVDFVRAARASEGGASIIALPSTARGGQESRIVAHLHGPVTTARSDVDWVITEHGAVSLAGLGLRQRAQALAGIADPLHRETLLRTAAELYASAS